MFPTLNLDTLVSSINAQAEKENAHVIGDVILLKFNEKNEATIVIENGKPKFAETIEEKIIMFLQVLLRTELNKYEIYDGTKFGVSFYKFKGKKIPNSIIVSEIKREITENLKKINKFDSIENFSVNLTASTLNITFNLILNDRTNLLINL